MATNAISTDEPPRLTKGQRTRARLLSAAEEVFGEGTYDEASIVEITRRAGVSQGTFYLYFPGKIDVFREVVADLGHQVRQTIAEAVDGCSTRAEVERRGFEAFFEFLTRHPGLYRIIRQAEFVHPESYRAHYERLAAGYIRGLKAAMADGEFRELDPEVLAYSMMGMVELLGARWLLWGTGVNKVPKKVIDAAVSFVLDGARATS